MSLFPTKGIINNELVLHLIIFSISHRLGNEPFWFDQSGSFRFTLMSRNLSSLLPDLALNTFLWHTIMELNSNLTVQNGLHLSAYINDREVFSPKQRSNKTCNYEFKTADWKLVSIRHNQRWWVKNMTWYVLIGDYFQFKSTWYTDRSIRQHINFAETWLKMDLIKNAIQQRIFVSFTRKYTHQINSHVV